MNRSHIDSVLGSCSLQTKHKGLGFIEDGVSARPDIWFEAVWDHIVSGIDTDDGCTIEKLMAILSKHEMNRLREAMTRDWIAMDQWRRKSLILSATTGHVLRFDDWLAVYNDPRATSEDKHSLLAALSYGAFSEAFAVHAEAAIAAAVKHDDPVRDDALARLKARLRIKFKIKSLQ